MKDYYYLLGIEYAATRAEVTEAYRKLATKNHPDKNQGDPFFEVRFKEINEAYNVLSDRERRSLYDMQWRSFQEHLHEFTSMEAGRVVEEEVIREEVGTKRGWFQSLKSELLLAIREKPLLFFLGIAFLLISSIYLALDANINAPRLVLDSLLILFMSAAFSGAMVFLLGFFYPRKERFSLAMLKNIPIYLIIICLFRMLVAYDI